MAVWRRARTVVAEAELEAGVAHGAARLVGAVGALRRAVAARADVHARAVVASDDKGQLVEIFNQKYTLTLLLLHN